MDTDEWDVMKLCVIDTNELKIHIILKINVLTAVCWHERVTKALGF